jgi:transposase-like protein
VASKSIEKSGDPRRDVARAILDGRLTRAEAARELGVSKEAVSRWARQERARSSDARSRFVAVAVRDESPSEVEAVEVVLRSGVVLRLRTSAPEALVVRLVRALASSC